MTGSTPAQLASEKGHRYLAHYLKEYMHKEEANAGWFGKSGPLSWLTSTQLCPVIWLIIIVLLTLFVYKVSDVLGRLACQSVRIEAWQTTLEESELSCFGRLDV